MSCKDMFGESSKLQANMEAVSGEAFVVPFFGQGHLFPCMELCKRFSSHNYKAILIIPSNLSSSIPSSLRLHSLIKVVEIPNSPSSDSLPPAPLPEVVDGIRPGSGPDTYPDHHHRNQKLKNGIESFLTDKYKNPGRIQPVCAVIDVMMSWSKEVFLKFDIPTVSFFTSGSCSSAMDYAAWEAHAGEMKPGEVRNFIGLPKDMELSYLDLKRQQRRGPPHRHDVGLGGPDRPPSGRKFGPPEPGSKPRWLDEVEDSIALFFNTCNNLEHPFINYIANKIDKPVYGIGPLLPEHYWKSFDSILHDGKVRSNRKSNYTEDEVIQWLDSKLPQSVIYVSFGSEVGPTLEEYAELANALEQLNRPFIWVIQPGSGRQGPPPAFFGGEPGSVEEGYYPYGLDEKVGKRGLIIKGWAPQLLILSHTALGGFLSHCGWNSTVEAIGRGVPILAWPIRGDQFYNAKLVVKHLRIGHFLLTGDDPMAMVKKDEIMKGIELLLDDKEVHKEALTLRNKFEGGFPESSVASLKSFVKATVEKH